MFKARFFNYNEKYDTDELVYSGEYDDICEIAIDLEMFTGSNGYVIVSKIIMNN